VALEKVDEWFEIGYEQGSLIQFGVFDKRVLLSLEQVAHTISTDELCTHVLTYTPNTQHSTPCSSAISASA